jgi:hypothetical protein
VIVALGDVLSTFRRRLGDNRSVRADRLKSITGRVALGLTAVVLAGATVILTAEALSATSTGGSDALLISPIPPAAGNLPRFTGVAERPLNLPVITPYLRRFQDLIGGPHTGYMHGLYGMPGQADPATNGAAWVMYAGYNEPVLPSQPAMLTRLITALAGSARTWTTAAGPAGGTARCGHTTYGGTQVAICAWVTARTIGAVMSPARTTSAPELATLMRQMRPDLSGLTRPASFP